MAFSVDCMLSEVPTPYLTSFSSRSAQLQFLLCVRVQSFAHCSCWKLDLKDGTLDSCSLLAIEACRKLRCALLLRSHILVRLHGVFSGVQLH